MSACGSLLLLMQSISTRDKPLPSTAEDRRRAIPARLREPRQPPMPTGMSSERQKTELGPSLATAAPKTSAGLFSRRLPPGLPTWGQRSPGNCSQGLVGPQSQMRLWGPLCSHRIP